MTELHGKIYLTKADMPKGCDQCPFCNGADECMVQNEDSNFLADTWDDLRRGCPLEEIEPVTVQEWIPVTERLPDLIPSNAGTAYSEAVNVLTSGRKVITAIWDGTDFIGDAEFWEAEDEEITHWTPVLLPLPQPPEGE